MPYVFSTILYLAMALLMAFDAALIDFEIIGYFNGIRWLRIHFITLGTLTQALFGSLPLIVASARRLQRPTTRWDIWMSLNVGFVLLLVGIPLINSPLIITGGTLILIATLLLIGQLVGLGNSAPSAHSSPSGKPFYVAGLSFFTLGILIGTGLWSGWMPFLRVDAPLEVHIHANNWGLFSLVFAGLLISMHKTWTGRDFPRPKSVWPIFWLLTTGAFGLVFGPWLGATWLLVPGFLAHIGAIVWLLTIVIGSHLRSGARLTPGLGHLVLSYTWILAPILIAPLVLLGVGDLPQESAETMAPQTLVYGWALQFGVAIVPWFLAKMLRPAASANLGGTWTSLALLNIGSAALWIGIFQETTRNLWSGLGYLLWAFALVPVMRQVLAVARANPTLEQKVRLSAPDSSD